MAVNSRIGRNPFEKKPNEKKSPAKSASLRANAPESEPASKPLTISKQLIEEAIQEARREEALAKARVAGKSDLSMIGRLAGWLAVDLVAGTYVIGLKALLFAKSFGGAKRIQA